MMMVSQVNLPQMALFQVSELYDIIHPDDLYLDCLSMFMGNNDVDIGPRYDSITTGWWFGTCFSIYWEESSQLTHIFQRGSNHQPL